MNEINETPNLNGARVIYREGTAFVPLPRELWRDTGGCSCRYCSGETRKNGGPSYWDTLAIPLTPRAGQKTDTTYVVHMPEAHGAQAKRAA